MVVELGNAHNGNEFEEIKINQAKTPGDGICGFG